MKILVMAAYGNQGRVLLPRFRDAGLEIRAIRRTPGGEKEVLALGADEVIIGDASDRSFLREAVAGVDVIYHIGPTAHPQEREIGFGMIDAAREAGIGHFIYSSVLHPIASKLIQHKTKRDVEEYLLEANIGFTILQPADYMIPALVRSAFENGLWEQIYDLDRGQAMVHLGDIADVAVKVALEREKHFGATYQLASPGNHSGHDIADAFMRATGHTIKPALVSPDEYFGRYYGVGGGDQFRHELAVIRAVGLWYSQYVFAGNPNVLTWLLGRPPISLDDFIRQEWEEIQTAKVVA